MTGIWTRFGDFNWRNNNFYAPRTHILLFPLIRAAGRIWKKNEEIKIHLKPTLNIDDTIFLIMEFSPC